MSLHAHSLHVAPPHSISSHFTSRLYRLPGICFSSLYHQASSISERQCSWPVVVTASEAEVIAWSFYGMKIAFFPIRVSRFGQVFIRYDSHLSERRLTFVRIAHDLLLSPTPFSFHVGKSHGLTSEQARSSFWVLQWATPSSAL